MDEGVNPEIVIVPSVPPHVVGLVDALTVPVGALGSTRLTGPFTVVAHPAVLVTTKFE